MTQKRLLVVIAVVTFLGLVTVWQQIQTMRWGYRISESTELKKQLVEEQKTLEIQLTNLTSPQQLLARAQDKGIKMAYQTGPNTPDFTANRRWLQQRLTANQDRDE